MTLNHTDRHAISLLPDMQFGEGKGDYIKRVTPLLQAQGFSQTHSVCLAAMKWEAWEVQELIKRIEAGDMASLREGVIRLLSRELV